MSQSHQQLAILFADIGESTSLYERLGDTEAHRQISLSLRLMGSAIVACNGKLLRTVGDSVLASFTHCDDAFYAARAIQQAHQSEMLSVRVGFHYGDVIPDKGDVYGTAVNIAARVASFARLNEITLSADACNRLTATNQASTALIDAIKLKGIETAMEIHRIEWQADRSANTVVASASDIKAYAMRKPIAKLDISGRQLLVDEATPLLEIGRDESNNLTLNADCVSRHHLQLRCKDGQILLIDNSTNGTFINREDYNPMFVRRETMVLEGSGLLGVGATPGTDGTHTMQFSVRYV
ncbi:MAG: adenylate/guanylate cyclase domain-containing protein [Granulosicoccaceae bacterium]